MSEETNSPDKKQPEPYVIRLDDAFWAGGLEPEQERVVVQKTPQQALETSLSKKTGIDENPYNARYEVLRKASTQVLDDSWDYGNLTSSTIDEIVEPLYNMERLTVLNDISVVRAKCVEAITKYTCGLGYQIKKIDPTAETVDSDKVAELVRKQLEKWASRDERTFTELMEALKQDEETTGNAFLEVSRNRRGEIDGLYHVPAYTVRLRRDRSGYIQQRGVKKVPFYRFGDKVVIREDNSIEFLENRDPKINEIIHFKIQSPRSSYYGVPRDVSAIVTIAGDEMARTHNIKFFTHSATPELALVFEVDAQTMPGIGGDQPIKVSIPEQTKRQIAEHFRRNLAAHTFEPGLFFLPNGVRLRIEKISQGQKDSGWTKYRQENRSEVRMAFRTPPVIIGDTAGSGYATAAIEKAVYQEGVIGPEQVRYQERLMALLWPEMVMITEKRVPPKIEEDGSPAPPVIIKPEDGSGVNSDIWRLEFKKMAIADKAVEAANHQIYGTLGTLTKNEIRADIGRRPMEGGDKPPEVNKGSSQDITGLNGRAGGGRGPNGTVTPPLPRRPTETKLGTPPNLVSVGNPMSNAGVPAIAKRDEADEIAEELTKQLEDAVFEEDFDALQELKERLEDEPELADEVEAELLAKVDDAFRTVLGNLDKSDDTGEKSNKN